MTILVPVYTSAQLAECIRRACEWTDEARKETFGETPDPTSVLAGLTSGEYTEFGHFALMRVSTGEMYLGMSCSGPMEKFLAVFPTAIDFVTSGVKIVEVCAPHPQLYQDNDVGEIDWTPLARSEYLIVPGG